MSFTTLRRYLLSILAIPMTLFAARLEAVPVQIGNAPVFSTNVDGGTPTNVDLNGPMVLAAGTYMVTDFNSAVTTSNGSKSILPYLVTGTPSTYTTIWVGPAFTPSIDGVHNVSYPINSQTFTLLSPATVYAVTTTTGGPLLSFLGGGSTDHQGSPGTGPLTLNQVFNITSNPGLGRTYSFNFIVDEVPPPAPEPASVLLLGMGLIGLSVGRRRNRTSPLVK